MKENIKITTEDFMYAFNETKKTSLVLQKLNHIECMVLLIAE
jgi:hypothetical protein